MEEKVDWYPRTDDGERVLYGNIDAKIDGFEAKYPFLTVDYRKNIHRMCETFMEGFDKVEQNRATAKKATAKRATRKRAPRSGTA